ncbi:hypothetical protein EJ06DRAFT_55382 [Trichodelitschia bisporula]|uniref:Uncharacterized protein n=1 Tax=Trichodelitschia bisporula TaxID=703511 RepID=A0A6G1HTZ7_9PEZI|nr:hypothetical protein EJ06DRAFT_55382 [Trichodelitschia bisporula]
MHSFFFSNCAFVCRVQGVLCLYLPPASRLTMFRPGRRSAERTSCARPGRGPSLNDRPIPAPRHQTSCLRWGRNFHHLQAFLESCISLRPSAILSTHWKAGDEFEAAEEMIECPSVHIRSTPAGPSFQWMSSARSNATPRHTGSASQTVLGLVLALSMGPPRSRRAVG